MEKLPCGRKQASRSPKKSNLRGPMRGTTNKDKTQIKLEKLLNAADESARKAPLNGYGPVETQPFCHGGYTLQRLSTLKPFVCVCV